MPIVYERPEKYFDDFAPRYDKVVTAADYKYTGVDHVFNAVSGFLAERPDATVLDIGCGTGLLGQKLKGEFPGVTLLGIDVSAKMRAQARKKAVYSELKRVNLERDQFPFKSGVVDLCVSSATYDYVKKISVSFSEISRVLAPQRPVCITTCAGGDEAYQDLEEFTAFNVEASGERYSDTRDYAHAVPAVLKEFELSGIDARHVKTFDAFCSYTKFGGVMRYHLFEGQRL